MCDSDQLELELDDTRVVIPWGGISPRLLTRGAKVVILVEPPAGGPHRDVDQFTLFMKGSDSYGDHETRKKIRRNVGSSKEGGLRWLGQRMGSRELQPDGSA